MATHKTQSGGQREALRRQLAAKAAADRRSRTLVRVAWIVGAVLIVGMIGTIVWAFTNRPPSASPGSAQQLTPTGVSDAGGIMIGKPDAKVTVTVYADFMCPYCGQFERANGQDLANAVNAGTVKLDYHPLAFLDAQSGGTRYSSRAANAFVTMANTDPTAALQFSTLLFANQPKEGSAGLTDAQVAAFAKQAGASEETIASFSGEAYKTWISDQTTKALDGEITGTPTVKINGTVWQDGLYTPGALATAIAQAANG